MNEPVTIDRPPVRSERHTRRRPPMWVGVFTAGLGLFWMGAWVLAATQNVHLVPSVLLVAALLVPVTFVAFLHGRMPAAGIAVPRLALTAVVGGILGVILASVFEGAALAGLGILPVLAIGLIEEAVKLLAPTVAMLHGRRTRADAVLLGVASGLGFATFETLGYAFAELVRTEGQITSALTVLLERAMLAPLGHAAWTGVTAVAVWRLLEARRDAQGARSRFDAIAAALLGLAGTYGLAVLLHSAWNLQLGVPVAIGIAAASILLLGRQLRRSRRNAENRVTPTVPEHPEPPPDHRDLVQPPHGDRADAPPSGSVSVPQGPDTALFGLPSSWPTPRPATVR